MAKEVRNPFADGPYVQAATFCERALQEADGVLSLVRLVDVVTHAVQGPQAPQEMPTVHFPLTLVIALKAGAARGRHDITITPRQPSGEVLEPLSTSIRLEGENRGTNLISRIDLPYTQEGLHWFEVQFDGELAYAHTS